MYKHRAQPATCLVEMPSLRGNDRDVCKSVRSPRLSRQSGPLKDLYSVSSRGRQSVANLSTFFWSCAQMSSYKSTFQLVPFSNFITFVHFFACTVLKFYHTCPLFCLLCSQMSSYLSTFLFCSVLKFHNICPLFCLLRPQILSYLSTILFSLFSNVIILVHSSVCSVLKFHNTCPLFCLFRPRMSSYLSIFLFALFSIASYLFTFLFALFSNFIIPVHFSVCSVLKFHHISSLSCLLCSQIPSYIFIVLFVLLPDFITEFQ